MCRIIALMAYKKLKSVRLSEEIVNLVKDRKKETYMPISIFFEKAAEEKLEREAQEKSSKPKK